MVNNILSKFQNIKIFTSFQFVNVNERKIQTIIDSILHIYLRTLDF